MSDRRAVTIAIFNQHSSQDIGNVLLATVRYQIPHFFEELHELLIGQKLHVDLFLHGLTPLFREGSSALPPKELDIGVLRSWHRHLHEVKPIAQRHRRTILGDHSFDLPMSRAPNAGQDFIFVVVGQNARDERRRSDTQLARSQHAEDFRISMGAARGLDPAARA